MTGEVAYDPRVSELAKRLSITRNEALGMVTRLRLWTPPEALMRFVPEAIRIVSEYEGDATQLVDALQQTGLIRERGP